MIHSDDLCKVDTGLHSLWLQTTATTRAHDPAIEHGVESAHSQLAKQSEGPPQPSTCVEECGMEQWGRPGPFVYECDTAALYTPG